MLPIGMSTTGFRRKRLFSFAPRYLSRADQSTLPAARYRLPANNALGVNVVVGERVWGVEQKFRLRLGPLSYSQFLQFIPRGEQLLRTAQFVGQLCWARV